jgi:hypothetical protein
LIEGRKYSERGCVVLLEPRISAEAREAADEAGRKYIFNEIEAFVLSRDRFRASGTGKNRPDPHMYDWLKRFRPDDELFAERSANTDSQNATQTAIERLTDIAAQLTARISTAPAPAPVEVVSEDGPIDIAEQRPRRKSLESPESYKARTGFDLP